LGGQLEAAAALVFAQPLPDGVELDMEDSMSYPQWLRGRLGGESGGTPDARRASTGYPAS
jgi:hypothetical protein